MRHKTHAESRFHIIIKWLCSTLPVCRKVPPWTFKGSSCPRKGKMTVYFPFVANFSGKTPESVPRKECQGAFVPFVAAASPAPEPRQPDRARGEPFGSSSPQRPAAGRGFFRRRCQTRGPPWRQQASERTALESRPREENITMIIPLVAAPHARGHAEPVITLQKEGWWRPF